MLVGRALGWLWDARGVPQEPSTAGEERIIPRVGREETLSYFPGSVPAPSQPNIPGKSLQVRRGRVCSQAPTGGCLQSTPWHEESSTTFCSPPIICFHTQCLYSRLYNLLEMFWERFGECSAPRHLFIRTPFPNI